MKAGIGRTLFGLSLVCASCGISYAQGVVGELLGVVRDPSGAVIPGAQVTVRDAASGAQRQALTAGNGAYLIPSLPPGTYSVSAMKAGFKVGVVNGVELLVKQSKNVDVTLEIGKEIQVVNVNDSVVTLDTEEPSQTQTLTTESIVNQPLNGNNYIALTQLSTGAVPITNQVGEGSGVAAQTGGRTNTSVSIGGNREQDMTYTYDGVDSKGSWLGSVSLYPPPDAIGEFAVQQGYLSPEFGPPVVVNVIIKSGDNAFHGSAFDFLRNDVLDARNYFDTVKPPFRQNQFGITAGYRFPWTGKHHWFAYYEGLRSLTGNTLYATVPSPSELKGDFSDLVPAQNGGGCLFDPNNLSGNCLPTPSSQIIDPVSGMGFGTPNVIPGTRLNSLATAMMPYFSPPNRPMDQLGNYEIAPGATQNDDQFGFRTDHTFGKNDTIHTRFAYSNSTVFTPGIFAVSSSISPANVRNVSFGWIHVFSSNLVNEVRGGYNGYKLIGVQPTGQYNPAKLGFVNVTDILGCVTYPSIGIGQSSGLPTNSGNCFGGNDKDFLAYDNLSWVHGKSNFALGADIRRVSHFIEDSFLIDGNVGFYGDYSGSNTADFLLGAPSQGLFGIGTVAATNVGWWGSYYFNDNVRLTPKFTVNAGARYQNNEVLRPNQHNYGYFDFAKATLFHPPQDGLPPGVQNRAMLNFAPRVGINYELTKDTVIRSAYGIYFVDDPADDLSFDFSNPPSFGSIYQFASGPGSLTYTVNQGAPTDLFFPLSLIANTPATGTSDGSVGLFTRERNRKTPYVQQWNLSIQRTLPWAMLLEVAYVGNEANHLSKRIDENTANPLTGPPCSTSPVDGCDPESIQQRRPYPTWGSIFGAFNIAPSDYNALQTKIQKNVSNGLSFLAAYTWGKAISWDDYDAVAARNYSWLRLRQDRARATYDRRQRLVINTTYALPFGKVKKGFIHELAAGWQLTTIESFTTGAPFGVTTNADYAQIGNSVGFARPDQVCANGNLSVKQRTIQRWFDTSCFAAPVTPYPHLGNAGYDMLDAPGITQVDASADKEFSLWEKTKLQFRADIFNVVNVPNFGEPGNRTDAANYGVISSALPPRQIQLALKIIW